MSLDDTLNIDESMFGNTDDNPNNKIIDHLFNEDKLKGDGIEVRTELTDRQVGDITKLSFLSKNLNIPEIDQFVKKFMRLKVSTQREGRRELIKAVESTLESTKTNDFMGKWGALVGGR